MADEINILEAFDVWFDRLYSDGEPIMVIRLDLRAVLQSDQSDAHRDRSRLQPPASVAEQLGHGLLRAVAEACRRAARKDH